jgi:hypothetical protein
VVVVGFLGGRGTTALAVAVQLKAAFLKTTFARHISLHVTNNILLITSSSSSSSSTSLYSSKLLTCYNNMVKADPKRNYYADLEISNNASADEIKKAFRKLGW